MRRLVADDTEQRRDVQERHELAQKVSARKPPSVCILSPAPKRTCPKLPASAPVALHPVHHDLEQEPLGRHGQHQQQDSAEGQQRLRSYSSYTDTTAIAAVSD